MRIVLSKVRRYSQTRPVFAQSIDIWGEGLVVIISANVRGVHRGRVSCIEIGVTFQRVSPADNSITDVSFA